MSARVQQLRVTFTRGREVQYLSHLDLMRFWERALRRADLPVAQSEGFTPRPQIALAMPLAVGVIGEAELLDVALAERVAPSGFEERLSRELPVGMAIRAVEEVATQTASLQSLLRWADYRVTLAEQWSADEARERVRWFLGLESLPWRQVREKDVKEYDIRAQVADVSVARAERPVQLAMRLKADGTGAGRPEQVVAALDLGAPGEVVRTGLVLDSIQPGVLAWRRHGRFEEDRRS